MKRQLQELKAEFGDGMGRYYMSDEKSGKRYEELPDEHQSTIDTMLDKYKPHIKTMGKEGDFNLDNDFDVKVDPQGIAHVDSPSTGFKGTINTNRSEMTRRDTLRKESTINQMSRKYRVRETFDDTGTGAYMGEPDDVPMDGDPE